MVLSLSLQNFVNCRAWAIKEAVLKRKKLGYKSFFLAMWIPIHSYGPFFNYNFKDKYLVVFQIPLLDFLTGLETFSQLVHEDDYGSVSIAID